MADLLFSYFTTELAIDFTKCRGQSYDNAANMAGRYNGMEQKIIQKTYLQGSFHVLATL